MLRKRNANNKEEEQIEETKEVKKSKFSFKKSGSLGFKLIFFLFFILYVVIPFSVYLCPAVRRHAVFLNYVSLSRQKNLSMPTESGLKCAKHFSVSSTDNVELGAWHVPPLSKCNGDILPPDKEFNDDRPVFLYLHGNAGTRGGAHRVELYKILSTMVDAHVVAFDYRGFGDSTNVSPTEPGLVQDTEHMFKWLRERVATSRIIVWGHSLGTGVSVAFLHRISKSPHQPFALVLEAPFTKIIEAASHHPLSILHRYMPFFDILIAKPIGDEETGFDSIGRIGEVKCPLLILHAEDDGFVPYHHGKKLHDIALASRGGLSPHATQFVGFSKKLDHGHKNIFENPDLPNIIMKFLENLNTITN